MLKKEKEAVAWADKLQYCLLGTLGLHETSNSPHFAQQGINILEDRIHFKLAPASADIKVLLQIVGTGYVILKSRW